MTFKVSVVCLTVVVWGVLCMGMCVCRCVCVCMHIWCRHCMGIQPAFGLITVHTYTWSQTWVV